MTTRVLDLDWPLMISAPLELGEADALLALVRIEGRPFGLLRVPAPAHRLTLADLERAAAQQLPFHKALSAVPEPPTPAPPISIVVCTRERPDPLATCLKALQPFHAAGHEILIVENAPQTDTTAQLIAAYPYRRLCEPRPGLNYARTLGLMAARYDWVAFTDDDCLPDPGWLAALSVEFQDPQVWGVTGLVLPYELETPAQERFEAYCANRRIFARRKFTRANTPPAAAGVVGMGANMAFRRERLLQAGGFDPRLDGGSLTLSGGDTDAFGSILQAGGHLVYTPAALVWHRHGRDASRLPGILYGYGSGLYAYLTKRVVEQGDYSALLTAARWLVGPPLKAIWNRARGRPAADKELVLAEFRGALSGPARFLRSRRAIPTNRSISL